MSRPFNQHFAFIVGAPRTGTTSLAKLLRAHPHVRFSKVKEPHFFSQWDLTGRPDDELRRTVRDEYLARYFPYHDEPGALFMEGSVTYLYAPEQMEPILRLWPDAKFIIGLRDPMEMIPSLHQRLLFLGDEAVEDFEQAWGLIDVRRRGQQVPRSCIEPRWLRYDEVGRLGAYVERFIAVVGRERCFFSLYDDLKADPAAMYREVQQFLGLPLHEQQDLAPRRVSRGYRFGWLQRLLMRPPGLTRKLVAGTHYRRRVEAIAKLRDQDSVALRVIERSRSALLKWNETEPAAVRLSPALRTEIRRAYSDDIAQLGQLIGRDLSHWLA